MCTQGDNRGPRAGYILSCSRVAHKAVEQFAEGLDPSHKLQWTPASCQSLKTDAEGSVAQLECLLLPACCCLPACQVFSACHQGMLVMPGQPCLRARSLLLGDFGDGPLQGLLP